MGCVSSAYAPEVNLNFSNPASPTDSKEEKIHSELDTFFKERKMLLSNIEEYKSAKELVRAAMTTPTVELERIAFEGLLSSVSSIDSFRVCARYLERMVGLILQHLISEESKSPDSHSLTTYQTLTMDLAEIFNFVCQFDNLRLSTPDIANDFAFYRRLLPKFPKHPNITVKDDLVAEEAMFSADHSPMKNALFKAAREIGGSRDNLPRLLAVLANSCLRSLNNRSTSSALESKLFIARTMVLAIVCYDNIGALLFSRDSPIRVRECILGLKSQLTDAESVPLLRLIRYNTTTYQAASDAIQGLLEDV